LRLLEIISYKEKKTMTEFTLTESDPLREIDLANSRTLTVTNLAGASVQIFIDYNLNGTYTSAIKGSAGYRNPFTLVLQATKVVLKSDLESERVRVGIEGTGAKIKFIY
jgi:hypothetical protein